MDKFAPKKLFFFGGTFDPPHRGHYQLVRTLLTQHPDALVLMMPSFVTPLRSLERYFSYRIRFSFLSLLFREEIQQGRVRLSTLERKLPRPNYTITTLEALSTICPMAPSVVIGFDQAIKLPQWKSADALMKNYHFTIFPRLQFENSQLPTFDDKNRNNHFASQRLPAALKHFSLVEAFNYHESSTEIRKTLSSLNTPQREKWVLEYLRSIKK